MPKLRWIAGFIFLVLLGAIFYAYLPGRLQKLSVTFFNCGQGNAILIHTPNRKAILIDGGWGALGEISEEELEHQTTEKKGKKVSGWDFGESGIAPTLSKYEIPSLDLIVNTSPRPGNLSAIPYIIENFPVKELVLPYAPESFLDSEGNPVEEDFYLHLWGLAQTTYITEDGEEIKFRQPDRYEPFLKTSLKIYADLARNKNLKIRTARAGDVLYEEVFEGKKLSLTVLHPRGEQKMDEIYFKQGDDPVGSRSFILKLTYGDFSCLIPTQVSLKTIESLVRLRSEELPADVLLLPKNGHPFWNPEEWIKAVKPKVGIIQYGYLPRSQGKFASVRMQEWYLHTTEKRLKQNGVSPYRTDQLGAVIIQSEGSSFDKRRDVRWILTKKKPLDFAQEDAGEKLQVGIE